MVFMASMMSRVSPCCTRLPTSMNTGGLGIGRAIGGADHGRLHGARMLGRIAAGDGGSGTRRSTSWAGLRRRRGIGGSRNARGHGQCARDADLEAALLDLDLREPRVVEKLRKLADQALLAGGFLGFVFRRHSLSSFFFVLLSILFRVTVHHPQLGDQLRHGLDSKLVTLDAEAADHAFGRHRHIGMMPEALTAENIRQMHLDNRQLGRRQGIQDADRGVSEPASVQYDARGRRAGFLNPADQLTLMIWIGENPPPAPRALARASVALRTSSRVSRP